MAWTSWRGGRCCSAITRKTGSWQRLKKKERLIWDDAESRVDSFLYICIVYMYNLPSVLLPRSKEIHQDDNGVEGDACQLVMLLGLIFIRLWGEHAGTANLNDRADATGPSSSRESQLASALIPPLICQRETRFYCQKDATRVFVILFVICKDLLQINIC